jgi:hypothetical protein
MGTLKVAAGGVSRNGVRGETTKVRRQGIRCSLLITADLTSPALTESYFIYTCNLKPDLKYN